MKWIFVWLTLASVVVAAAAGSCSINHRSDRFQCINTFDCEAGRTCSDGVCVPAGLDAPTPDGPRPDGPNDICPPQCTQCVDKVCIIDCAVSADCNAPVVCPAGFSCDIRCNQDGTCRSGVNCTNATACTVLCSGRNSCRGVMCGAGPCNLNCTGMGSCETVSCNTSCACDVKCSIGNGSCQNVDCTRPECDTGRGCSATILPVCSTCQ